MEIRPFRIEDAEEFHEAVIQSEAHLSGFMSWAHASATAGLDAQRERVSTWITHFEQGPEWHFGLFENQRFLGVAGIHDRVGPESLEIGYWVRFGETGKGYATLLTRFAIDYAFSNHPNISSIVIKHDEANLRSRRIPEKLKFTLVERSPREIEAKLESGITCTWKLNRTEWN